MDGADRAEQLEQQQRDIALQQMKQDYTHRKLQKDPDGHYRCVECDAVVPDLRVEQVNATRCVECQTAYERQGK